MLLDTAHSVKDVMSCLLPQSGLVLGLLVAVVDIHVSLEPSAPYNSFCQDLSSASSCPSLSHLHSLMARDTHLSALPLIAVFICTAPHNGRSDLYRRSWTPDMDITRQQMPLPNIHHMHLFCLTRTFPSFHICTCSKHVCLFRQTYAPSGLSSLTFSTASVLCSRR
jgi:hypothetical protein